MEYLTKFSNTMSLEERKHQSQMIREKYKDRLPVIVDRVKTTDPEIDKHKFLTPQNLTLGEFTFIIRKRFTKKVSAYEGLYFFHAKDKILLAHGELLENLFSQHVDEDGFLRILYTLEATFGA